MMSISLQCKVLQRGKHQDEGVDFSSAGVYASSVRQLLGEGTRNWVPQGEAPHPNTPILWVFLCWIKMRVVTQKAVFVSRDYRPSWRSTGPGSVGQQVLFCELKPHSAAS